MDAVKKGLTGRRVCGGIEVGFGILFLIGAIQPPASFLSILFGVFIVQTGLLGTVSKTRELVIVYLVTGILSAVILISSIIVLMIARKSWNMYTLADTSYAILIVAMVIVVMALIVTVLGVTFACLPLCGNSKGQGATQPYHNTSLNTVGPPSCNDNNTIYPDIKQEPV